MSELTLESLARRIEELERKLARQSGPSARDWRKVVGMFAESEFSKQVDEEGLAIREAERRAAREGRLE